MNYKSNTGFTLLEVIIVMSILTIIIGGAMYVLFSGQETFDEGSMTAFLESQATRLIDVMKDDISEGLVITSTGSRLAPCIDNGYTAISIQVPVLVSGNYWNSAGDVYWGAYDNNNTAQLNWYITYSFYPDPLRTNVSEATDRKDYNRDGDIDDSFDIGEMVKDVYNAAGVLQQSVKLCNDIMTVAGTRYADIKTGADGHIFTLLDKSGNIVTSGGNRVRINIWLGGKLGAKQNPIIINTTTDIALMNPQ